MTSTSSDGKAEEEGRVRVEREASTEGERAGLSLSPSDVEIEGRDADPGCFPYASKSNILTLTVGLGYPAFGYLILTHL